MKVYWNGAKEMGGAGCLVHVRTKPPVTGGYKEYELISTEDLDKLKSDFFNAGKNGTQWDQGCNVAFHSVKHYELYRAGDHRWVSKNMDSESAFEKDE